MDRTSRISVLALLVWISLFHPSQTQSNSCAPPSTQADDEIPVAFPSAETGDSLSCGESLESRTGGIFYKPFEPIAPNERCVWTIGVPNARGYDVTVNFMGWHPTANNSEGYGLIISDFGRSRAPRHIIPTTSNTIAIRNSSLVMVTFFSGNESNFLSGFILQYRARTDGILHPPVAANSRHAVVGPDFYWSSRISAAWTQLSSWVFLPRDSIYREGKISRVIYNYQFLYNCRTDQIKVYFFNTTCVGANKWQYRGRLCMETHPTSELIQSSEPMLLVYDSGTPTATRQFSFAYTVDQ